MPELTFACTAIEPDRFAAAPAVTLRMRASGPPGVRVHAAAIRCQVRIEPRRRGYTEAEGEAMADLFGDRERWGTTMQALQLAFLSHLLPGFVGGDRLRPVAAVQLRLPRRGQPLPRGARGGRGPAAAPVQRHRVHRCPRNARGVAGGVAHRDPGRTAGQGLAWTRWTPTSPARPGCASTATRSTGWPSTAPSTSSPAGRTRSSGSSKEAGHD